MFCRDARPCISTQIQFDFPKWPVALQNSNETEFFNHKKSSLFSELYFSYHFQFIYFNPFLIKGLITFRHPKRGQK